MLRSRFLRTLALSAPCFALSSFDSTYAADARRPIEVAPGKEIDFWNPEQVKPLLEELISAPAGTPVDRKVFYAQGVGHFDDFIPMAPELLKEPIAKNHLRLTYHDGRIAKCECFDAEGALREYQTIGTSRGGAPRVNGSFRHDGKANWYKYATYDSRGRIAAIYTFGETFELRFFEEFTYRGEAVDIRRRDRERNLQFETIYEDGGIFLIADGVKKRVNAGDRKQFIRLPTKHGLKPIYPGYESTVDLKGATPPRG